MATISGNTVTGAGPQTVLAQNGIQVSNGAGTTLTGNTVSGNECNVVGACGPDPLANTQSAGILLFAAAAGTTVMSNPVSANDIVIYNLAQGTTISGNTLMDNRFEGIVLDEGDATLDSNTIDPGNVGILVVSFSGNMADSKGTLTCNTISAATQAGIRLVQGDSNGRNAVATATNNSITGNVVGVDNTTTSNMDAHGNWWGCALGPGNASCDTVGGPVDVSSPLPVPPVCPPPTTTTTTIASTTTTIAVTATTTTTIPTPPQCLSDASCGDGNICNGVETCRAGVCTAGTPLNCDDSDPCTVDSCDPRSGCQHTMVADLGSCSIVIPGGEKKKSDCYVVEDLEGRHSLKNPKT